MPELDEDHRQLVAHINAFHTAASEGEPCDGLLARLDALIALATDHCAREGQVIKGIRGLDPGDLEGHAREHSERLAQLAELRDRLAGGGLAGEVEELANTLIDWFVQQAVGFDAQIRAYFVDR